MMTAPETHLAPPTCGARRQTHQSQFTIHKLRKRLGLVLAAAFCLLAMSAAASAQTAGDYRSAATGNWNAVATWERFDGVSWVAAVASPTSADGVITVRSPNVVTISASGLTYDQVVVDSGGQVTVAATVTTTIANGAGTDLTINGTWLHSGGTWTISASATWAVGAGGTYIHNTASSAATPLGVATLDATSTVIFRGSSTLATAVSFSGRTFGHLIFESTSGTWTPATITGSTATAINGDFTIGTNVNISGMTYTGVLTIAGSFTQNGTLTFGAGTQNFTFTGSGKTISGSGAIAFETWNVNSGASITLGTSVSIASTFVGTVSGILTCGTNVVSGAGTFALSGSGTLKTGDVNGITADACGTGATCGSIRTTTRTFSTTGNYTYNGGSAQVTGDGLPATANSLVIDNSAGVTLTNGVTVATLSLSNGTFTIGSSNTVTIANLGVINRSSGGIAAGSAGGTIAFAGGATVSGAFTFNNVTLAGAVDFGTGPTTIGSGGTLTINAGGSVLTNAPVYHAASILKYNTGGSITRGTEWGNVTSGQGYPGNVQISNSTTFNITTPSSGDASISKEMAVSLTVDLGSTFDLTGMNSFTFCHGSTTNNGTFTGAVSIVGQFRLSGNWTNNGTYNNGGGTAQIWFDGAGVAQTLGGSTVGTAYGSLQINNSLGVTVNTALSATQVRLSFGPFNNGSNVTLANGALIFRASGTFGSVPTFGTTVNVTYGSAVSAVVTDKELPTDPTVLSNLTNQNTLGVTLGANVTVNGTLTLTADLNTGAFVLTEKGTSSGAGDVIGDVMRTDLGVTAKAFGNPNVQVTMASGTITTMTVNLDKGHSPTDFPQSVLRNYTLTPGAGTVTQATVRLHYTEAELNSNVEDATLILWRKDGGSWVDQGQSAANFTDNWVEWDQVDQFSPWTISGPASPTAVRLTRFNAASFNDGVAITWESGFEVNNLGYHIYRTQNGVRTRLTPAPIAGSALKLGPGARMTAGYSYSWFDPQGTPDASYSVEAIDLNGMREPSVEIYPRRGVGNSPIAARKRAVLLTEVARTEASAVTSQYNNFNDRPAAMRSNDASKASSSGTLYDAGALKAQQAIAAGQAVKISVPRDGWYRITQAELLAAGLDANADARRLQLFVGGEEVPILVNGDQARLRANDSIEFYGVALNTPSTDTQVYWLVNGATPGKRLSGGKRQKVKAGDTNWADDQTGGGFAMTTKRSDKLVYFSGLLNGEGENIFGPPVTSDPLTQTLTVRNLEGEAPAQVQVSVTLQGLTAGDHIVAVKLNGSDLGAINFKNLGHPTQTFPVDRSLLHEGDNSITLTSTNGEADVSLVDSVSLTYRHAYRADNNALRFSAAAGQPIMVGGFSSADIRVVDVTNPAAPNELAVAVGAQGSGYAFKLQAAGAGTRSFIAFTDDLPEHASRVAANEASTLNVKRSADMIIVTHRDFRAAVEPLAAQRRSEGLQVAVVDIEDVYDEFSFGAHTPYALRDFISWTANHWQRAPQYLLLAGDSSWDPRNYLDQGNGDFVPTRLIDTAYMETASDDWLADANGDGAADMAVGRLPGRTAAEIGRMVSRILLYEQERQLHGPARGALLVADNGFEASSQATAGLLPSNIAVQKLNRSQVGSDDVMRGQIVNGIDNGPMIVNYYGHGSVTVWTGAGLLDSELAATLTNSSKPSLFVMMTCLNGYAHDAYIDSLAESLLKSENGGAMAVWASSGFTDPGPQFAMNQQFYRQLFSSAAVRLGDAARAAKAGTSDNDVRRTWMLLGDPSMRLQ